MDWVRIRILEDGRYSDFTSRPRKVGAQDLAAGNEVEVPLWYACSLIESGVAEGATHRDAARIEAGVAPARRERVWRADQWDEARRELGRGPRRRV